jgi:guanylate kinase
VSHPFPLILSSPSGGGKTTIAKLLLERRRDLGYSVSCTTRLPRDGEVHGVDYFFLRPGEFVTARDRGDFAEWAEYAGRSYGTLRSEVHRVIHSGRHVVMDIEVQGARQFAKAFPDSVLVFIMPPSADVLLRRLYARGTEDKATLARRIDEAVRELEAVQEYQYVVINDDLERAVNQVSAIIDAESLKRTRSPELQGRVAEMAARLRNEVETM